MQQWDHQAVYNTFLSDNDMNIYGKDGWRLSSVVPFGQDSRGNNRYHYFFIRPIPDPSTVSSMVGRAFNDVKNEVENKAPSCYDPRVDHRD